MKLEVRKAMCMDRRWTLRRGAWLAAIVTTLILPGTLHAEDAATEDDEPEPTLAEPRPEKAGETTATVTDDVEPPAAETPPTAEKPKPAAKTPEEDLTKEEKQVLDQLNAERRRWGRRPLRVNRNLMKAARRHASNMARWNMMSHTLGGNVSQRVASTGSWMRSTGENIAQGQWSPQQVMSTWMASTGHRNNILSTGYTDVGISVARSNNGTPYWVQVFALP